MARAIGIDGVRVEHGRDLPAALREVLDHDGPALLDVVTARQELAVPPHVEREQMTGFGLWLIRAVLDGRGQQIIDLAKTNLKR